MPKNNNYQNNPAPAEEPEEVPLTRAERRDQQRARQQRASTKSRRGRERRLTIRSEQRATPDTRKIARAIIAMAAAAAERDAAAQRPQSPDAPEQGSGDV